MLHNIFKQTWGEIEKLGVSGTATPWKQGNTIKKKPIQSLAIAHPNDALCIGTLFSLQQPLKVAMVLVNSHKTPQIPAKDIECFNFWYFGWKNTKKLGVSGTATPWKQGNTIKKSQFGVSIAHPNDALCIKNRTTWILRNFAYRVGALMLWLINILFWFLKLLLLSLSKWHVRPYVCIQILLYWSVTPGL
jgi:hypothetical protein